MTTQRRKGWASAVAAIAKRNVALSENVAGKSTGGAPIAAKKRPPLGNLTNQRRGSFGTASSKANVAATKGVKTRSSTRLNRNPKSVTKNNENQPVLIATPDNTCVPMDISSPPPQSCGLSVSIDESLSTSDSLNSPDVEYLDENDLAKQIGNAANLCKREILLDIETIHNVVDLDNNFNDPQLCAPFSCDIYNHLRASEMKKRPATDYMEKIQEDINPSMRSILVDWLVEVAEEYKVVLDTLYLTVNYIDRYLSGNSVNRQRLQLLGIACMMIAAKYEEICAPQVEEYCFITDNTYVKDEVLQMESKVLNFLKFEMTAPTTKCFLRRFVRAAQACSEGSYPLQLECLANYIAELYLLDYDMLRYAPSITAASTVFLANYMLVPEQKPWNSTLQHYTHYEPSHLQDCVRSLHQLCLNAENSSLPAIREKYSQHKYKCVAKKQCPPTIPLEYLYNVSRS